MGPTLAAALLAFGMGTDTRDEELQPLLDPPPAVVIVEPMPTGYYRPSRWDVWQYYAVDRTGHFRPRVVLQPEPHYLYNGQPYYFLPVRPLSFMPYVFD